MMEMMFLALLGTAFVGAGLFGNDNDEDPPEPNTPTEDDDLLTVGEGARGEVDGLGGNDDITVTTETGATSADDDVYYMEYGGTERWQTEDGNARLIVNGGAGDDVLRLSGDGYEVFGGAGADSIDLGDAHDIFVRADAGDTVSGGEGDNVLVMMYGDSVFWGSDADQTVGSRSTGTIDLGAGNDWVTDDRSASMLLGGDGDDLISGSEEFFNRSETDYLTYHTSTDVDTLDGGAGNDRIGASHGDLITTGSGTDQISLYLEVDPDLDPAIIEDFDPALDRLNISYGATPPSTSDPQPPPLVGIISTVELGGDTVIFGAEGQQLVVLRDATDVSVGVYNRDSAGGWYLSDLSGNPTPGVTYDVLIDRYSETST